MKLIDQAHYILASTFRPLQLIESAGRTCYKSESKIDCTTATKFVKMLKKRGHWSVIEHATMTIKFITNRGVTHELVRHRLASFSQESTRYVSYGGKDIRYITPVWWESSTPRQQTLFKAACKVTEWFYKALLVAGWRPEQAREVLPNALKTEIVVTTNLREWHHILDLRTTPAAHPQIRALMLAALKDVKKLIPVIFDDLGDPEEEVPVEATVCSDGTCSLPEE
jgi:thymidylate synthase (FAD)